MKTLFILLAIELIVVSLIDLRTKKISNYWVILNIIASIICYASGILPWELEQLYYPIGTIVVGFTLFLANIMGAGDSKYLASLFFLIPNEFHQRFLENVVISTIMVASIWLVYKVSSNFKRIKGYANSFYLKGVLNEVKSSFSYAPVILLAWILLGKVIW